MPAGQPLREIKDPPSRSPLDGSYSRWVSREDRDGVCGQIHAAMVFSEEAASEKYMSQLQHNMWVTKVKVGVLSIITGGGKWVEITIRPIRCAPQPGSLVPAKKS